MKKFLDENFLLNNNTAQKLYHNYAKDMPIIDYHCHLSPPAIASDHQFRNLTEVWLAVFYTITRQAAGCLYANVFVIK